MALGDDLSPFGNLGLLSAMQPMGPTLNAGAMPLDDEARRRLLEQLSRNMPALGIQAMLATDHQEKDAAKSALAQADVSPMDAVAGGAQQPASILDMTGQAPPDQVAMSGRDIPQIASYIYNRAPAYGVNPNTALGIARYEGLNPNTIGSPTFGNKDARGYSFGPFQLFSGSPNPNEIAPGGMAHAFMQKYGEAPSDKNWKQQADFALATMGKGGYGNWYAVRDQGGLPAITQKGARFASSLGLQPLGGDTPLAASPDAMQSVNFTPSPSKGPAMFGTLNPDLPDPNATQADFYVPGSPAPSQAKPNAQSALAPFLQAMALSLMSSPRNNMFQNMPQFLAALSKQQNDQANQAYSRSRDEKNDAFRRSEAQRQADQWRQSFQLQEQTHQDALKQQQAQADKQLDTPTTYALGGDSYLSTPRAMQEWQKGGFQGPPPKMGPGGTFAGSAAGGLPAGAMNPAPTDVTPGLGVQPAGATPAAGAVATDSEGPAMMAPGVMKFPKDVKAPTVQRIKQPDGSEVAVQWDDRNSRWIPLVAPQGGNAVRSPKMTEGQSKDLNYVLRGTAANNAFTPLENEYASGMQRAASSVPGVGNYAVSEDFQKAQQAGQEFLNSVLRKDSGAAITQQEQEIYGKVFLPQPGDKPGTIAQKRAARARAMEAMRAGLGPAEVLAAGKEAMMAGPQAGQPTREDILNEIRRRQGAGQ